MLGGRRTFLRQLGAGCLAVAGLAIPRKVQAFFHRRAQAVPVFPQPITPVCSGQVIPGSPALEELQRMNERGGVTSTSPTAGSQASVNASGQLITASVAFSGTVYNVQGLVQPSSTTTIAVSPPNPAAGQIMASQANGNVWFWTTMGTTPNPLTGVAFSASPGTQNTLIIWWQNTNVGQNIPWQVEAWSFFGVPAS